MCLSHKHFSIFLQRLWTLNCGQIRYWYNHKRISQNKTHDAWAIVSRSRSCRKSPVSSVKSLCFLPYHFIQRRNSLSIVWKWITFTTLHGNRLHIHLTLGHCFFYVNEPAKKCLLSQTKAKGGPKRLPLSWNIMIQLFKSRYNRHSNVWHLTLHP